MNQNHTRADRRTPTFTNIIDALAAWARGNYAQEVVFEPTPLPSEKRAELEAITRYLDPVGMAGNLSGLLMALQSGIACGEILQNDMADSLEAAHQFAELLHAAAHVQADAEYRLHLADLHEAREAGRREGLEKKPRRGPQKRAGGGDA